MTYKRVFPLLFLRFTILQFLSRCLADFNEQRTFIFFPFSSKLLSDYTLFLGGCQDFFCLKSEMRIRKPAMDKGILLPYWEKGVGDSACGKSASITPS